MQTRRQIADMIRKKGYRATPQRIIIYEALWKVGSHPTVAEVHKYATQSDPSISLATVYNTLHLFEEIGLVREMSAKEGSARYDPNTEAHVNLICQECGKVVDYECSHLDDLLKELEGNTGFRIDVPLFEIKGLCDECRKYGSRFQLTVTE